MTTKKDMCEANIFFINTYYEYNRMHKDLLSFHEKYKNLMDLLIR